MHRQAIKRPSPGLCRDSAPANDQPQPAQVSRAPHDAITATIGVGSTLSLNPGIGRQDMTWARNAVLFSLQSKMLDDTGIDHTRMQRQ